MSLREPMTKMNRFFSSRPKTDTIRRWRGHYGSLAAGLVLAFILWPASAWPGHHRDGETGAPLVPHLKVMVDRLDHTRPLPLPLETVRPVVDFVLKPGTARFNLTPDRHFNAPSAYYAIDIHRPLPDVLRIGFNPDIPSVLTSPASVRWSHLKASPLQSPDLARLVRTAFPVNAPVLAKASEYIENTPDPNSGAYHGYLTDRLLILLSDQGRDILVSLSRQRGPSQVGKKGMIVGADNDWNYLYSDQEGLSRTGLGWVRSRIFESFSVSVYIDTGSHVRCGIFQWMRAGWAGLNMVRSKHIYAGLKRYAETFRDVLEHPLLPGPDRIEAVCSQIRRLPEKALNTWFDGYLAAMEDGLGKQNRRWIARHLAARDRSRESLESRLALEWMKQLMGKTDGSNVGPLLHRLENGAR
jgi:hypothetical protein